MKPGSFLALVLVVLLLALLPFFFGQLMVASLAKLHLSPGMAILVVLGIFAGSVVNIPLRRIPREGPVTHHPLDIFGLSRVRPELRRQASETVIAVNVGGCVIPSALVLYEIFYLATADPAALGPAAIAAGICIAACYVLATPVEGVGILIPGLVPPLVAATLALVLAPEQAPPVAFIAGVAGPLIGADLLHLKDIRAAATGIASIGGAGTFDGIVLSGIVAAYLA